jgi:hypothetical protein
MKISSANISFKVSHEKSSTEIYQRTSNESGSINRSSTNPKMFVAQDLNISYEAKITQTQSSATVAHSKVNIGSSEVAYHRMRNSHQVTSAVLGVKADISNVEPIPFKESIQVGAYKDIDKLAKSTRASFDFRQDSSSTAVLQVKKQYQFTENENLNIASRGSITTADGVDINFKLNISLSKEFELSESFQSVSSKRIVYDPIVINFAGGGTELTHTSFAFDLNADGAKEEISFVGKGSGFLVLDKNNDGVINDGKELFGTQGTGGFEELSQYDSDQNQWLDENDAVFEKLKIWSTNEQGIEQQVSLKEAGIGAIYLGAEDTSFDITDSGNSLLGKIKKTAIFLKENGEVGSIQEVDLAVHSKTTAYSVDQFEKVNAQISDLRGPAIENEGWQDNSNSRNAGNSGSGSSGYDHEAKRIREEQIKKKKSLEALQEKRELAKEEAAEKLELKRMEKKIDQKEQIEEKTAEKNLKVKKQ